MRTAEQRKASQRRWYDKVHADPVLLARQNQATREWRKAKLANKPDFRASENLRRKGRRATPEKWASAQVAAIKIRAQKIGIPFDLTADWLLAAIPAVCPIFQTPFVFGRRSPQNASVDRLLPDGGYTRANVRVISQEANLIKRRCTDPVVFQRMAIWLERELAAAQRRGDESRRAA